jgi:excisionase family DNA binding protein
VRVLNGDSIWLDGAASTAEAARWLGCSRRTVWRLIEDKTLTTRSIGRRRLIAVTSLKKLLPAPACGVEAIHNRLNKKTGNQELEGGDLRRIPRQSLIDLLTGEHTEKAGRE